MTIFNKDNIGYFSIILLAITGIGLVLLGNKIGKITVTPDAIHIRYCFSAAHTSMVIPWSEIRKIVHQNKKSAIFIYHQSHIYAIKLSEWQNSDKNIELLNEIKQHYHTIEDAKNIDFDSFQAQNEQGLSTHIALSVIPLSLIMIKTFQEQKHYVLLQYVYTYKTLTFIGIFIGLTLFSSSLLAKAQYNTFHKLVPSTLLLSGLITFLGIYPLASYTYVSTPAQEHVYQLTQQNKEQQTWQDTYHQAPDIIIDWRYGKDFKYTTLGQQHTFRLLHGPLDLVITSPFELQQMTISFKQ